MVLEICAVLITLILLALLLFLLRFVWRVEQSIQRFETDFHLLSVEMGLLLNSLKDFVESDLHTLSQETIQLIGNVSDLSAQLKEKMQAPSFLFRLLSPLAAKLGFDSAESSAKCETIPQVMKWIGSSVNLFKEFIGKYDQRKH